MKALFNIGGPFFSNNSLLSFSILTFVLIILFAWAIFHSFPLFKNQKKSYNRSRDKIKYLKSIGLFALVYGVLDQLIGLYSIFFAIEKAGDINARIVFQALKTSMIPLLYAIFIYLSSILMWIILDFFLKIKMKD
ncbi:MAG: hypothetical protein DRI95_10660 [Bacteroidetes bacterium]|nr:MAG: hypothetical protein DRI95_10660 [Bacteroidota bacterium]